MVVVKASHQLRREEGEKLPKKEKLRECDRREEEKQKRRDGKRREEKRQERRAREEKREEKSKRREREENESREGNLLASSSCCFFSPAVAYRRRRGAPPFPAGPLLHGFVWGFGPAASPVITSRPIPKTKKKKLLKRELFLRINLVTLKSSPGAWGIQENHIA